MLKAAGMTSEVSTLICKSYILRVRGLREKRLAAKDLGGWEEDLWAQSQVRHWPVYPKQ